ncbi:MAG: redoxin domain-containing protein [Caldisericia bacterium]|nr:redoxin domain-containing protein [Caldisericia bacterium]
MKKRVWLLIFIMIGVVTPFSLLNAEMDYSLAEMDFTARKYVMQLNQQPIKLDISPIWHMGSQSLLIPLRFIAEMNRFSVGWDAKANLATFQKGDRHFSVSLRYPLIELLSDQPLSHYQIILKGGRFLLDHRTVEKLMGIRANVDEENNQVVFYADREEILYIAPQFALFDLKGNQVDLQKTLNEKSTRLVILNFYSTRCPICAKAIPNLQKLHEDFLKKGIVVIGINTDTKNMEAERDAAIKKYGLTYPILLDPNADVYTAYSVAGIPNIFVIDKKREIIQHRLGVDDSYFAFLRKYLDEYLKTK